MESIDPVEALAEDAAALQPVARRKSTSSAGDVLKLVSGTTFAQALSILVSPLLTRLFMPDAFGTLALYTSMTTILTVVSCLRYELAIMLPESDDEAANLLAASLLSVVAITLLTTLGVTLGRPLLLRLLNAPEMGPYLWFVPTSVFFAGVFHALNYWNSRTKQFGRLSVMRMISSASTQAAKLVAGYAGFTGGGTLIGTTLFGSALSTGMLARKIWRDDGALLRSSTRFSMIRAGMERYKKFPLIDMWGALMNTVSVQLPALLLSSFFSSTVVGYYALGYRILTLPMALVGGAISQVFYQRASTANVAGNLTQVVESTLKRLMVLAVFPFMLLSMISPDIFGFVFGEKWIEAGVYAQILSPWLFFVFLGSPISTLYCVLERQRVGLFFNAALVITRAASLTIGGLIGDSRIALTIYSISGAIIYAVFSLYQISMAGISKRAVLKSILRNILISSIFLVPSALAKWAWGASPFVILAVSASASVLYYLCLLVYDRDLRAIALKLARARK